MSVAETMDLMSSATADAVPDGAPTDAERYRDILRDNKYLAALAVLESYPWPDLAGEIRAEFRRHRSTSCGTISLGSAFWYVDMVTAEVYPIEEVEVDCPDCDGQCVVFSDRWERSGHHRVRGFAGEAECETCCGTGKVYETERCFDRWEGDDLYASDDPIVTAQRLIIQHYQGLPEQFRADLELGWQKDGAS